MFETKAWAIELNFKPNRQLAGTHFFQYWKEINPFNEGMPIALFKTRRQAREAEKHFILCKAKVVRVEVRISMVRKPCTEL